MSCAPAAFIATGNQPMLDEYLTLTKDLLRDDGRERVSDDQIGRALSLAIAQYSKDRPRRSIEDAMVEAQSRFAYPTDASVSDIEYPIGGFPPTYLPRLQWGRYEAPDGVKLAFKGTMPEGVTVRLVLLRAHVLDVSSTTIPAADREAVVSYAVAILFDQIAAQTSGDGTPTIAADAVNHAAKPENYARRAERLRQRYYDLIGLDPKRVVGASVTVSRPLPAADGGGRLTHRRR